MTDIDRIVKSVVVNISFGTSCGIAGIRFTFKIPKYVVSLVFNSGQGVCSVRKEDIASGGSNGQIAACVGLKVGINSSVCLGEADLGVG